MHIFFSPDLNLVIFTYLMLCKVSNNHLCTRGPFQHQKPFGNLCFFISIFEWSLKWLSCSGSGHGPYLTYQIADSKVNFNIPHFYMIFSVYWQQKIYGVKHFSLKDICSNKKYIQVVLEKFQKSQKNDQFHAYQTIIKETPIAFILCTL